MDYGDARIGLALSDPLGLTAQALSVIQARAGDPVEQVAAAVLRHGVEEIVVGYPLNMNGSAGPRARLTAGFADALRRRTGVPVVLADERLTSAGAERLLLMGDVSRKKRRQVIDKVAAALILQAYLDSRRRG